MTFRIVVGTDFTDVSTNAILHALQVLGAAPTGELHLTHVVLDRDPSRAANVARDERLMAEAIEKLKATLVPSIEGEGEGARFERKVVYHVRVGTSAAQALEQVALDVDAALVVVGTHGRKGLERFMLGSVARELLENGRVPMLVARPRNFEGMTKSDYVEAPRPGEELSAKREDLLVASERVSFVGRPSRIAGLV